MRTIVAMPKLAKFCLKFAALLLALAATPVQAVPSFARQTNLDCSSCHLSWPELTPTGRKFKLSGYTWGERKIFPVAGLLEFSHTATRKVDTSAPDEFEKDRTPVLQEAAVFIAGKITDHIGVFGEWAYDAIEHHSQIEGVDLRYADRMGEGSQEFLYGLTLHNMPAHQDIYNTGIGHGFPFASSDVAIKPSAKLAYKRLGEQVAGLGAYGMWRNTLYGEFVAYRTADKVFSVLRAGTDRAEAAALKGYNPYWRLALQHEWGGAHSAMVGAFGMQINRYPDNTDPSGPSNRFNDLGFDAQYQYIDPNDTHRLSSQVSYVREKQKWNASAMSNPSGSLKSFKAKASYYHEIKYGLSLGYFGIKGTADDALYNNGEPFSGSRTASPNSNGYIVELDYLPLRDLRLALQYTGYTKFNGARTNYDGFGRNAKDNNTLFLLAWWLL